jgi:AraC-like DNA-binding protein
MPERCGFAGPRTRTADREPVRTAAALPYLQCHFHEKIALASVAPMCGMGAFEFSRCFRREQGVTFRDYLMRVRIEAAAHRLRRGDQTVLDVACSVGFNDPSQFARQFRRHMGVTPKVYRGARAGACATRSVPAQRPAGA